MDDQAQRESQGFLLPLLIGVLFLLWQVIRLPALALLTILEPIVGTLLVGLALAGTLIAFMFEFATTVPNFPFWGMIAISVGCVGILGLYHLVLHLLSL